MIHLDAERIRKLLDYPYLVEALRDAHAGQGMPLLDRCITDAGKDTFVNLMAWAQGRAVAVKLVGVFPENVGRSPPEPSIQGIVVLFDGQTGRALMTCDGAEMTYRKTAADSALGASFLARRDARTLLVIGAGGLAPHMVRAHRAARPELDRFLIWNRSPGKAMAVADELSHEGIAVEVQASLDDALGLADIISSVTMATAPLIKGVLLKPGTHVDLVGSYLPGMREADDDVMSRAALICMDIRAGHDCTGDIIQPMESGVIHFGDIRADLFELATGAHPGRASDSDITVFKNIGGGHLDLFTAMALHRRVAED
ncbi:ornithine cyclodeaminase [Shinella sp. CPCC 101442]|uniref:ornithine cyclodeaminase n=1 Tax=Shinella sp. CPCC 101442 TaxID=2932265 RepID=UPI0021535143|nr:ornithine cyclodeaminase [Shinella sp. CPCC 101442]MCR6503015.1 ornithine cyclodeaminase [Shinella sp. CPCC 101442]